MTSEQDNPDKTTFPPPRKKSRAGWLFILVAFGLMLIILVTGGTPTLNWAEDYDSALRLAQQQNKHLLLAVHSIEIPDCTKIKRVTYRNAEVREYVVKNFVPVKLDAARDKNRVTRYHLRAYPAHIIINPRNDKYDVFAGYRRPNTFLSRLAETLENTR